ncbi:MAG: sigma factor-like helix-turn-helix DNA-binding protein [Egibacteraceae bacterium]
MPTLAEVLPMVINDPSIIELLRGTLDAGAAGALSWREDAASAIDKAAAILAEHRAHRQFGEVLPGLATIGGEPITGNAFPARVYNALARSDVRTWGELARMRPLDVREIRNVGIHAVHLVATAAVWRVLDLAQELTAFGPLTAGERPQTAPLSEESTVVAGYLAVPIRTLAEWALRERDATLMGDILCLAPDLGWIPEELRAAWEQASELTLASLLSLRRLSPPADLVTRLLTSLDERDQLILRERLLTDTPTTLSSLGDQLGISRGRVQQLQSRVATKLRSSIQSAQFAPLRWRAEDLADMIGTMLPLDSPALANGLAWATRDLPQELNDLGGRLLLWLAGPYRSKGTWLVHDRTNPYTIQVEITEHLDPHGLIDPDTARALLNEHGVRLHAHNAWLQDMPW